MNHAFTIAVGSRRPVSATEIVTELAGMTPQMPSRRRSTFGWQLLRPPELICLTGVQSACIHPVGKKVTRVLMCYLVLVAFVHLNVGCSYHAMRIQS